MQESSIPENAIQVACTEQHKLATRLSCPVYCMLYQVDSLQVHMLLLHLAIMVV